jgi:hypothetical protein
VDLDYDASSLVTMFSIMRWIKAWFKRAFLLDHEPCGRLRSSSGLVIGSIRFCKI